MKQLQESETTTHRHPHTHAHAHTCSHTCTHTHTHASQQTLTYTSTHTHTCKQPIEHKACRTPENGQTVPPQSTLEGMKHCIMYQSNSHEHFIQHIGTKHHFGQQSEMHNVLVALESGTPPVPCNQGERIWDVWEERVLYRVIPTIHAKPAKPETSIRKPRQS